MEITNELLAAYAEGNVSPEERQQVRKYLAEHPSQLESVMMMMDSDYGLDVKQEPRDISFKGFAASRALFDNSCACISGPSVLNSYFQLDDNMSDSVSDTFSERLDHLLDEIS